MSLDTFKLHKLQAKEFDKLYVAHTEKWNKMVTKAVDGVRACVDEGAPIKAGDVVAALIHGVSISKEFENHLETQKLTQKYWASWFAEYVVEQIYPHAEIKENKGVAEHVQE